MRIIVNPVAGLGKSIQSVPGVKAMLTELGLRFDVVVTEHPGHAAELAKQAAAKGFDAVVAMGGDGTANEVINGLMEAKADGRPSCAMGVLCVGRGNDFAFGVGIPQNLKEGCRVLVEGFKRTIDIGRVTVDESAPERFFGNGIGIGFDTVVGFEAAKHKRLRGFLSYLVAALKTLFFLFQPPVVRIACDGEEWSQPALMVSVMNGQRMGGGFMMAPDGVSDDGKLNVCVAGVAGRFRLLMLMLKFMNGTQARSNLVKTARASSVSIEAQAGELPAHADGETLCEAGKKLDVELLAGQLDVITASPA
jgi:YegS/Rv2252/BmrU family lipid kinase